MYIGPAGKPISFNGPLFESMAYLKQIGLNAMEIEFVRGIWANEKTAEKIGEKAEENNIFLSVHAPYYLNLISEKKNIVNKSKSVILTCLKLADVMKAHYVVFHPGFYGKLDKKEAYTRMKNVLQEISDAIADNSWRVKLAPETMGNSSKFGSLEEIVSLAREIKHFHPTIDWAHLHARDNGRFKTKEDFEYVFKYIKSNIGLRVLKSLHNHITGVEYTEKGERYHLPLSSKKPNYKLLISVMKQYDIKDWSIISESPLIEKDALKFKSWIKI